MVAKRTVSLVVEYKNGKFVSRELNQTADAVDRTEKSAQRTEAALNKVKIAAAAVGVALLAAMKQMYDAFTKQQDAVIQLEASLKAIGSYTPQLSKRFQELASQLQRTSRYGDEQLLPMFSKLISLGGVTADKMERVIRAAMDFAVITGSLESAVDLLAKASVGYTSTLSRYGIILDEAIPQGEKFEAVLRLIETRMGGMEKEMSEATSGGVKKMFNAIGDLMELGFRPFAPFVDLTSQAVTDLAYALADAANEAARLKDNLPKNEAAFGGAGIWALYAKRKMTAEEARNLPPLVGGSPITGGSAFPYNLMMTPELEAYIRRQQINRGPPAPGRVVLGGDMGIPEPRLTPPRIDMGQPPTYESGLYERKLAYNQAELEQIFGGMGDKVSQFAGLAQSSAGIVSSAFAGAFASMASGAAGAADSMAGALLGALGTLSTMYGSFLIATGTGLSFLPGGQSGIGAAIQGGILLALGGTLQGLAAGMGTSTNTGAGGLSVGRSTGGAAIGVGGAAAAPNIFIVTLDGKSSRATDIVGGLRSSGVEGQQLKQLITLIKHQNSTGTNVAELR